MTKQLLKARLLTFALSALLLSSSTGCMMRTITKANVLPAPENQGTHLMTGDVVNVAFRNTPEMNILAQPVGVEGKIALVGVGEVEVGGLTLGAANAKIVELYKAKEGTLEAPDLALTITSQPGRRVYVSGQVLRPGMLPLTGRITALEAIAEAGGFNMQFARRSKVLVIREVGGKRYAKRLNLETAVKKPESEPFYLAANDLVYVPRTGVTKLNQIIEQYITRMIPFGGVMARVVTGGA